MEKLQALKNFLGSDVEEITQCDDYSFETSEGDYLVLTDDEANIKARQEIRELLWAFNSDFIVKHINGGEYAALKKAIEIMQEKLCEDCNEIIEKLIDDLDLFVEDAISADGRGHFLASYDGEENEQDGFFIYRIN